MAVGNLEAMSPTRLDPPRGVGGLLFVTFVRSQVIKKIQQTNLLPLPPPPSTTTTTFHHRPPPTTHHHHRLEFWKGDVALE